jgi:uncharacterized protein (TIGR02271 family)
MASTMTIEQMQQLRGADVISSEGETIGTVEEIFMDYETHLPEWVGIGSGFLGTKRVLVPVEGATLGDESLTVPYSKEQVSGSPEVDSDEISQELERDLYAYYGLGYSESRSGTGLPTGGPSVGEEDIADTGLPAGAPDSPGDTTTGPPSVTRSEEELAVGRRDAVAGRARLRKWVETEPVEASVELRRETAHVERQPLDQPVTGAEIGEEEVDLTLHREEAVVQKQAVAKERITLEKDVEVETETVRDDVRREHVEVETDDR